eukprot:6552881-Prymnesium_polylepis.1
MSQRADEERNELLESADPTVHERVSTSQRSLGHLPSQALRRPSLYRSEPVGRTVVDDGHIEVTLGR